MSEESQLEQLIEQTIDGAVVTIPAHIQEIEQNKDTLKVNDTKEFVYGLIMGMALGMGSALTAAQKQGMPTPEDQLKVRDMVYKKIPLIRERIFQ